ncbi:SDR family NAD(P)-dependent oxidoreductase [Propionicimonas paludicola]|uniref:SDR family NAD(P)-dependent oxidoreductase n=1 Tax=Propionicimonas paludicola TaxID=185243 RepID=UPI0014737CAC|nr:SDR family NAD(P)-dependent oxidoreductase [Propionicimonas paludicola]
MTGLAGRVVCITGAAERAGAEFARRYVQAGAKVMISHLPSQAAQAEALLAELGSAAAACAGDITDPAQGRELVAACCDHFGRLDVLVHNASTFAPRPWLEVDEAAFDSALGVNLRGPFFLSQAAAKVMLTQGGGNIVALVGNSLSEAWPEFIPHSVAKTALARLMEQLAVALAPTIACNAVAPSQFFRSDDGSNDRLRQARGEAAPSGQTAQVRPGLWIREADLDAVFAALSYLSTCTPQVTGTTLRVDGGKALA